MTPNILYTRQITLDILSQVLYKNQNLDDVFDKKTTDLSTQDKSFIRMLSTTCLRRKGQIDSILKKLLEKKLPAKATIVQNVLRMAICQLIWMDVPAHAAVSTAVDLTKSNNQTFYAKLVNGVLRNFLRQKENLVDETNAGRINTPEWLFNEWVKDYGLPQATQIANANLTQATTFISTKENPSKWTDKLNGTLNDTGSIELPNTVYIPQLAGFNEGAWWVQDAAAALPVQVFDDLNGKYVADFCAAPGGKTAALLAKGAKVDAFDISEKRLKRVEENLKRLQFSARLIAQDANKIDGKNIYDAILIDAPCSATGTIRRHPDLYFHRTMQDIEKLTQAQLKLLKTAHRLVKRNGQVVYCTCSLQKAEGEKVISQIADLFEILPITNPNLKNYLTAEGFVRTFPYQNKDGFFIAKLRKITK